MKDLRGSLATVYGLENDEPIIDVQPLLTKRLLSNVEWIACPVDAAYLAANEAPVHPARCMRMPKRANYATREKGNNIAKLVKPRDGELHHRDTPHVNDLDLSSSRMINGALAEGRMPECVRKIRPIDINTANGKKQGQCGYQDSIWSLVLHHGRSSSG